MYDGILNSTHQEEWNDEVLGARPWVAFTNSATKHFLSKTYGFELHVLETYTFLKVLILKKLLSLIGDVYKERNFSLNESFSSIRIW